MDKLLVICGPTGTGKTTLAIDLAHQLNGELISADSRQVYKNFDALTGKDRPTGNEKIWMYDIIDVGLDFSVSQYAHMAQHIMGGIRKRGKLAIAVGGTGLYLKAMTQPLSFIHVPPDQELRKKFQDQTELLQTELQTLDKNKWEHMNQSDRNNPRRLIRALEISQAGTVPSSPRADVDSLWIGLTAPIEVLQQRIAQRIEKRWEKAVVEVKEFRQAVSLPILGFLEIRQYLAGSLTKAEAIRQWTTKERQYAKRQLTWFKKQQHIRWLDITSPRFDEDALTLTTSWYPQRGSTHLSSFDHSASSKSA